MNFKETLLDAGLPLQSSIYQQDAEHGADYLLSFLDDWFGGGKDLIGLEIGTSRGVSAGVLASRGIVITVDMAAKQLLPDTLKALNATDRVIRIVGNPDRVRTLLRFPRADYAFVDATHRYADVMRDFEFVRGHTSSVIFHDYCADHPGVIAAVDELHAKHGGTLTKRGAFAGLRLEDT